MSSAWIADALARWPPWQDEVMRVRNVIPDGFAAYARVFHPPEAGERWSDLAARHGRTMHAETQFHAIAPGWPLPRAGPVAEVGSSLAAVLAAHTTTADRCWFARWVGYGDMAGEPTLHLPLGRDYVVVAGPLDSPPVEANLWWPEDRAWCVVSEIDYAWTYVGGRADAIAAVLASPDLEALPATLTDRADIGGDRVNPPRTGAGGPA